MGTGIWFEGSPQDSRGMPRRAGERRGGHDGALFCELEAFLEPAWLLPSQALHLASNGQDSGAAGTARGLWRRAGGEWGKAREKTQNPRPSDSSCLRASSRVMVALLV